jgi:hypothetical protein
VVVPYSTCELEGWSVVQVMVADVAVIALEVTPLITGTDPPVLTVRSSSAGAAQAEGPETDEHVTEVAVVAVLSHRSIST